MDVATDDANRDLVRTDMIFHVILASYLRYGCLEMALSPWVTAAREGRSVRAKLWLQALKALDRGKAEGFRQAFVEIAQHHRQHEYSPRLQYGPQKLLMQEGGILWHLARRAGIAPAWESLPQEISDHLLTMDMVTRKA